MVWLPLVYYCPHPAQLPAIPLQAPLAKGVADIQPAPARLWHGTCISGDGEDKRENREGDMSSNNMDFYSEKKWCDKCGRYVNYLMSVQHSYCIECGEIVTLFSKEDAEKFHQVVEKNKYKAS